MTLLKVGVLQLKFGNTSSDDTFENVLSRARALCVEHRLDLLVLPELWTASTHSADVILRSLLDLKAFQTVTDHIMSGINTSIILGSFPLMTIYGVKNTVIYRSRNGVWQTNLYKAVPFGFGEGESSVVAAGAAVNTIELGGVTAQVLVCFDLRFPELFRVLSPPPAIFILVASWPLSRIDVWEKLLVARATENQSWVVASNSSGDDLGLALGGRSKIISPSGQVVLSLSAHEEFGHFEINLEEVEQLRTVFPVDDYRPKL